MPQLDWQDRAACRGTDPELFFADDFGTQMYAVVNYCGRCPVVAQCRDMADRPEGSRGFGVWGATTAKERTRERQHAEQAA